MNVSVRRLFQELADLPARERERIFAERQVASEVRAEVESLIAFDSPGDHAMTESLANAAEDVLQSVTPSPSTNWGPYRKVRLLGAGGMGSVFLAERTDGEIQQQVAVKLLRADNHRPEWRERFLQ